MIINNTTKSMLLFSLIVIATKTTYVNCFSRSLPKVRSKIIHQDHIHYYHHNCQLETNCKTVLKMVNEINVDLEDDDEEEEEVEVGTMRVSELKSELSLRGVDFSDCFDKESLAKKLRDARATGKSDPSIIDQFNNQRLEDNLNERKLELDDDIVAKATGGDGTLPGGMPPDMLQKLVSNPELMALMRNPKMQDVMKLMMTDGSEALEKAMEEDKEIFDIVSKLNSVMGETM